MNRWHDKLRLKVAALFLSKLQKERILLGELTLCAVIGEEGAEGVRNRIGNHVYEKIMGEKIQSGESFKFH